MGEKQEFNLSDLMCDSLYLNGNISPPTRPMFDHNLDPSVLLCENDPLSLLGETVFNTPKVIPEHAVGTPIQEFFRGVNVLVTGGSGFLGKVLTDKLIRTMPHIGSVYLMIRSKRGKSYEERFNILLEDKVFSRMKAEVPHYLTKLKPLDGDLCEPGLGLSEVDHHLIQDTVHVIFHCAALVNFVKPLKEAIASNVLGTERILNLAKSMTGLKAFVYVSTAFSQCTSRVIEEKIPKLNINYREILDFVESKEGTYSEEDIQKIMQGSPNPYMFSKAVCEDMLQEEAQGLPLCIVRPTMVTSTCKEPVRGWIDNLYGPLGIIIGIVLGVLHCIDTSEYQGIDAVPVDYLANCIIAATFKTGSHSDHANITVYNFSSKMHNALCWKRLINTMKYNIVAWPSSNSIWYTSFLFLENASLGKVCHIILHKIPGAILDQLAVLSGGKPRLGKIYGTLETLKKPLYFFQTRYWEFRDDNVNQLLDSLTEEDKNIFYFDVREINWIEYVVISWLGLRYYYLKESMDSISAAKRKRKLLHIAHIALKLMCGFVLLKLAVYLARIAPL